MNIQIFFLLDASYMSQESDYSLERTSVRRKYNLRDRRKISSPESKALSESPTAFEDLVHYMAIDSKRRSLQLRKTFMNQ